MNTLAWMSHPRDDTVLDKLKDTQNQPLQMPPRASQLMRYSTTSIDGNLGAGTDESSAAAGDFSQVLLGWRTSGVNIRLSTDGTATDADGKSWDATSQLMRHVVAYLRMDTAILKPRWLTIADGIQAS